MKSRNTKPELSIQFELRRRGVEFTTHDASLPGTPDIVLDKIKTVIFVNGCYWHRHFNCRKVRRVALTNDYWLDQFAKIVKADYLHFIELQMNGWKPITVWECDAIKHPSRVVRSLPLLP